MTAPQALRSLAAGKKQKDRAQEILTPEEILVPVEKAFGGQIQLDPCAASDRRFWFAKENWTEGGAKCGLRSPWSSKTFWNPPYVKQGLWMAKARQEWFGHGVVSIGLGKVCTHRKYFWPNLSGEIVTRGCGRLSGAEVVYLGPVYFLNADGTPIVCSKGKPAAASFALALFCWGVSLPSSGMSGGLGKLEMHREVVR